ncbi:MAG TPA: LuxR C-terminal-related transcriptional regulator [Phycisphaerales bacterium]|nr:LuxR C-terminal-related transcriptional regulator [Phycisphaerales bacterium]
MSVFANAPGVGVALVSSDLRILYANPAAARLYASSSPEELHERHLSELFPAPWVEERQALVRRVLATGKPVIVRAIMRGKQVEATILPVPAEIAEAPNERPENDRVLIVTIEGETPQQFIPEGVEVVESDAVDLGPLAVLTPRELEVLALIGQGHSAKEIASILNCSPRTVERHRDSIGKKLDKDDRVKLALVARAAGLELRDAQLNRVTLPGRDDSFQELKPTPMQRAGQVRRDGHAANGD